MCAISASVQAARKDVDDVIDAEERFQLAMAGK